MQGVPVAWRWLQAGSTVGATYAVARALWIYFCRALTVDHIPSHGHLDIAPNSGEIGKDNYIGPDLPPFYV